MQEIEFGANSEGKSGVVLYARSLHMGVYMVSDFTVLCGSHRINSFKENSRKIFVMGMYYCIYSTWLSEVLFHDQ